MRCELHDAKIEVSTASAAAITAQLPSLFGPRATNAAIVTAMADAPVATSKPSYASYGRREFGESVVQ